MVLERCSFEACRKKLSISTFACKCEKKFCPDHRYATDHACTFDYQLSAKQILLKTMSTPIVSQKVQII